MSTKPRDQAPSTGKANEEDHDSHGNAFKRVPGPGPNDAGKGAAGREALDRLAGAPERTPDGRSAEESEDDESSS
jgi:hypothetical protein